MNTPKISVLIPMYNRKHYIEQCISSALNQTFKDYEIIVRDDGSTDGSADFVEKRFVAAISAGRLKLRRNEKNIGEFPTDNRLLREANGKYIMILHSDDMFMPQALEQMFTIAENFNADVVHSSIYFTTTPDGVIIDNSSLKLVPYDKNISDKIETMSDNPLVRFDEWYSHKIGIDAHHNIFKREFIINNDLRFESFGGNRLFALHWLMKPKVLVKAPVLFYVYRDSPDSVTRAKHPTEHVAKIISQQIKMSHYLEEFFASDEFFKDKPEYQYLAQSHLLRVHNDYWIKRLGFYKGGINLELHRTVEEAFKEYFGDNAALPTFLFHWIHALIFNHRVDVINSSESH